MNVATTGEAEIAAIRASLSTLDVEGLHIDVMDNCVHLQGVTRCYATKREAAERARKAAPGTCIANELRVAQLPFAGDAEIAREATAAVARAVPAALARVRLDVREGVLLLEGVAGDTGERDAIERAAWNTRGVTQVANKIVVAGDASDRDIGRALDDYARRSMNLPAGAISVSYHAGVALLSGTVTSVAQGHAIEDLIRWHDHVRDVENRLRVGPPPALSLPRAGTAS